MQSNLLKYCSGGMQKKPPPVWGRLPGGSVSPVKQALFLIGLAGDRYGGIASLVDGLFERLLVDGLLRDDDGLPLAVGR